MGSTHDDDPGQERFLYSGIPLYLILLLFFQFPGLAFLLWQLLA